MAAFPTWDSYDRFARSVKHSSRYVLDDEASQWTSLVIEDVENQHLHGFLEKLNCAMLSEFHRSSYVVNSATVLALEAGPLLSYEYYL